MKKQLKMLMFSTALAAALPMTALAAGMLDLPRTGQTRCYDTAGKEIACAGTGQDAELRAGAALPVPRFKDNLNGTVTDKVTGLIWLKNANCFSTKNWSDALTAASTLTSNPTACGLSDGSKAGDWRLPNRNELLSIIDTSQSKPALPIGHPFANVVSYFNPGYVYAEAYWTSTSYNTGEAWYVLTYNGISGSYNKAGGMYVWPVRGGQ